MTGEIVRRLSALELITGASVMGAVFAIAAGAEDVATAPSAAVAAGMRITFAVAAALIVVALASAARRRRSLAHAGARSHARAS